MRDGHHGGVQVQKSMPRQLLSYHRLSETESACGVTFVLQPPDQILSRINAGVLRQALPSPAPAMATGLTGRHDRTAVAALARGARRPSPRGPHPDRSRPGAPGAVVLLRRAPRAARAGWRAGFGREAGRLRALLRAAALPGHARNPARAARRARRRAGSAGRRMRDRQRRCGLGAGVGRGVDPRIDCHPVGGCRSDLDVSVSWVSPAAPSHRDVSRATAARRARARQRSWPTSPTSLPTQRARSCSSAC